MGWGGRVAYRDRLGGRFGTAMTGTASALVSYRGLSMRMRLELCKDSSSSLTPFPSLLSFYYFLFFHKMRGGSLADSGRGRIDGSEDRERRTAMLELGWNDGGHFPWPTHLPGSRGRQPIPAWTPASPPTT